MICENCQTTLPDEALACWKCGKPVAKVGTPPVPTRKRKPIDPVVAVITLILSAVFFGCVGWAVPFTVWGKLTNAATDFPQWAQVLNATSTVAGVLSALVTFLGIWWLSAWLITRIIRSN